MKTPTGEIFFAEEDGKLTNLSWRKGQGMVPSANNAIEKELQAYFKGELTTFKTPIKCTQGTAFQQKVWKALCDIPYGQTVTYGDLAKKLNTHARAIGGAVGANPLPIIVPCHRVMGKNGKLTGFSGGEGVATKEILLKLEKAL
jgi:methylated-DNA-[protein]-cysteine S-methyltransferase